MGFFSDLINRRRVAHALNPLLSMKLQEFVIAVDDDTDFVNHFFRFRNKEGMDEEFIVAYRRFDPPSGPLHYLRTHWRRYGVDAEFRTLNEDSGWSIPINYLIQLGEQFSATTGPSKGHFASTVSAGILRNRNYVAPAAEPTVKREAWPPAALYPVDPFLKLASTYDPQDSHQLGVILESIYDIFRQMENNPDLVAYHAIFSCELAIFVRAYTKVDICTLTFPLEIRPVAPFHPSARDVPPLDILILALEAFIQKHLTILLTKERDVSGLDQKAKMQHFGGHTKMLGAFIWEGYLLALDTEPANWGRAAVCALCVLQILSTADPAKVVEELRDTSRADIVWTNVRDDDWPPRGYIDLYSKNRELLASKYYEIFGSFPSWGT
jgi:hypothetical protein